ncbi:YiiX/YebB-like N1pC/P60 family cysteine hydrolase [Neptunomonas marina]|uniref:YebB family permuted papain-like enzyme n=1 Tax=Neptunomonas marina TaxID=1815562 RepID=A0A437Q7H7_9GAMM|nr:YiiX/YebB-like N1pC/P60 family cysteine hydrolase [Neptunomonas marina]RVU30449.1 hypothetical protein EOE65_12470 [Neptunomonas marina]
MNKTDLISTAVTEHLKEGDLLFIAIDSFLYRQVAQGTGSWCSHVGVAIQQHGRWYVAESAIPKVRITPLDKFIARAKSGRIAVHRFNKGISDTQLSALKQAVQSHLGKWYHLGFNYDDKRMFCSKFTALVLESALGIKLGEVETLEQLITKNPQANVGFWRCWYLGFIPWKRRTITPESLLKDPRLLPIFNH